MTLTYQRAATGAGCFRCGYPLVGIADDQPCPECGLLAIRSRRESDELRHARPRWLRRLSWGLWLIVFALLWFWAWLGLMAVNWFDFWEAIERISPPLGPLSKLIEDFEGWTLFVPVGVGLLLGSIFLATPEGYDEADRSDRRRRLTLMIVATLPLIASLLIVAMTLGADIPQEIVWLFATVGTTPMPILLFLQLRSLAKRACSANLAEHCLIVGVGVSASLCYFAATWLVFDYAAELGLGDNWQTNSRASLWLETIFGVLAVFFYGWCLLLMTRFALAFARVRRELKRDWRRDDRAAVIS